MAASVFLSPGLFQNNGSSVEIPVPLLVPNGTLAAPTMRFTSEATGLYLASSGVLGISLIGNAGHRFSSSTHALDSDTATILMGVASDISVTRAAAGALSTNSSLARTGANGQALTHLQSLTELTTIAAAATTDTTIQMPAGAVVLAVSVRVTVAIPTAATFTVGDSGSAARFNNAAVTVAANSTDPGTKAGAYYNASALSIRITPNLTPGDTSGRVRVTIHYYTSTPPSS
jgi:hypothetical protein